MDSGFSPCTFLLRKIGEAEGKLLSRIHEAGFHGIFRNVAPVLIEAALVFNSNFGTAALPDLTRVPSLFLHAIRNPPLILHCALNRHVGADCQRKMYMIGHDDEIVDRNFFAATYERRTSMSSVACVQIAEDGAPCCISC